MKTKAFNTIKAFTLLLSMIFIASGCSNLFNNPLEDKETGEDITMFLIDLNFFDTKLSFNFIDEANGENIEDAEIKVFFDGDKANDLVDINGEKQSEYIVRDGELNLFLDPNVEISANNPLDLTVIVYVDDFTYFAYPKEFYYTEAGDYDILVELIRTGEELKSAQLLPGNEPFEVRFNENIIENDNNWYFQSQSKTQNGKVYYSAFQARTRTDGTLSSSNFSQDETLFDAWGIEGNYYESGSKSFALTNNDVETKSNYLFFQAFSATKRKNVQRCSSGINISVSEQFGQTGTARFNYTLTINNEVVANGRIGGAEMPFIINTGAFYHPEGATSAILNIVGDGQYDLEPQQINIDNFCDATVNVTAKPKSGLESYKIVTSFVCPGNQFGVAPSIRGKFKIKDSSEPWTQFVFSEGIATLKLKPGETYTIQGTVGSESATFNLPTSEAGIAGVLTQLESDTPEIDDIKFSFSKNSNNVTVINIEVIFKSNECPF